MRVATSTSYVIRGSTTHLKCPIDTKNCGELHSVKWFKAGGRIGVASGDRSVARLEGSEKDRYVC